MKNIKYRVESKLKRHIEKVDKHKLNLAKRLANEKSAPKQSAILIEQGLLKIASEASVKKIKQSKIYLNFHIIQAILIFLTHQLMVEDKIKTMIYFVQ